MRTLPKQLELTVDPPFYIEPVCDRCGARGRIEVDGGPAGDFNSSVLFAYVALKQHERDGCPAVRVRSAV